jgi:NADH-quinone oxidoreductase subunit E
MLRGAGELIEVCRRRIAHEPHQLSADGAFSWEEVECLGACVNAPMVQINDDYFEDLTPETLSNILTRIRNGAAITPGPQVKRVNSAPEGGTPALTEASLFDGSRNRIAQLPNLPGSAPPAPPPAPVVEAPKPPPADDLKRINGVGPKYEQMLREMGVTTFAQIAAWSQATVDATEAKFGFKDRIDREKWVAQAKMLAEGRFDEHELIYGRGKD